MPNGVLWSSVVASHKFGLYQLDYYCLVKVYYNPIHQTRRQTIRSLPGQQASGVVCLWCHTDVVHQRASRWRRGIGRRETIRGQWWELNREQRLTGDMPSIHIIHRSSTDRRMCVLRLDQERRLTGNTPGIHIMHRSFRDRRRSVLILNQEQRLTGYKRSHKNWPKIRMNQFSWIGRESNAKKVLWFY